jgi:hemolysin activation/secretion protein
VPERVLYGDSGLSATLEGSTPLLWQGLRLLAFVDAGLVRSDLTDSPARPRKDRLASVGVGLRYGHASGARLSADYGRVITGSRADPGANPVAPSQGDDKLHVNVSLAF